MLTDYTPLIYNTRACAGAVRFRNPTARVGLRVSGVVARERWDFCKENFEFPRRRVLGSFNDSLKISF